MNLSKELQDFYEKNKHENCIRNWEETLKKSKGFFESNFLKTYVIDEDKGRTGRYRKVDLKGVLFTSIHINNNFFFSFRQDEMLFYKTYFLLRNYSSKQYFKIKYLNYDKFFFSHNPIKLFGPKVFQSSYRYIEETIIDPFFGHWEGPSMGSTRSKDVVLFKELNLIIRKKIKDIETQKQQKSKEKEEQKRQEFHKKEKEKRERLNEEKKLRDQQKHFKNLERKKVLQEGVTKFINEFDSDKDGIIDFNQGGDDFMNLLKKHQKTIIQVDQNHITKLIQVSNYLKTKRGNIQTQFEKIKNSRNSKQLNEFTGILKNQIDTFNLLNYNSLIIIISLVEGDLITFNEIYLTFDKLNIFTSNWENQVSDKLNNIDSKLDEVIYSINKMELSIVNEILGMSIMNQVQMNRLNKNVKEGNMMIDENLSRLNSSLSSNLKSIDSTLKVGNLISTINTYQNYKINKNTKSLRG